MVMTGKKGIQKKTRDNVIKLLRKNKGKLVEVAYTKNISSASIKLNLINHLSPNSRVSNLKRLMNNKQIVRVLESHSPLSGSNR